MTPADPVTAIRFQDGQVQQYTPPRNTCDERARACTAHHPACDCREALFAEDRQEFRAALKDATEIIAHLIDAPCPLDQRRKCSLCRGALTSWLKRYGSLLTCEVPF